uniref:AraC family transcriptional regulator n=1 Tax=Agathobacter sp. TaxID=2021311 RepID=UPI0040562DD9
MTILEYENYHEQKNHVDLTFPYNTYLCSIPLDFSHVPLHWHDQMEIIYVKKGHGYVTLEFSQYEVSGNTIVLILPGQLHSIEQYENDSMEYENIIFNADMLLPRNEDSSLPFLLPFTTGKSFSPSIFNQTFPYYKDIASCIDACDEICKTKPGGYELFIKGKLYELFFLLNSYCETESKTLSHKSLNKMKLILKYVEQNYMNKIKIADVAKIAEFSESHFMRYFKETMGKSFVDYLRNYRLTMAARMLLVSESSILSISEETGFDNLSYFNRTFKKHYGVTPGQYRKRENEA